MELGLRLGQAPTPFSFLDHKTRKNSMASNKKDQLGFCMALGNGGFCRPSDQDHDHEDIDDHDHEMIRSRRSRVSVDSVVPLQLDLLPSVPVPRSSDHNSVNTSQFRFPWLSDHLVLSEPGSSSDGPAKGFDVNRLPPASVAAAVEETEDGVAMSSPNSTLSSFHMDFCVRTSTSSGRNNLNNNNKRDHNNIIEVEAERTSSRASDDEENGSTRKKLRLSKEQSAFLEESFKEHSTLNPKQKLALAKQLNLRPRQVEVWFQNRRARTKLKQTEVDCEYLKRCCETLTEENRRLQKELQELRALKTSQPFYMQLPATTLTMCPSCERVATATTNPATSSAAIAGNSPATFPVAKPIIHHPFSHAQSGKAAAS